MGRKSRSGGVEPKGGRIQLDFYFQGQRCRPTLDLLPSASNLRHAARQLSDITARIRQGTFDLGKEFPTYKGLDRFNARPGGVKVKTVAEYVSLWREANKMMSPSLVRGSQDHRRAAIRDQGTPRHIRARRSDTGQEKLQQRLIARPHPVRLCGG